ncbi:hypothetical protein MHBO_001580 [Bonamia ostreae]|uniref:Uncharacterized protein n=1 Tax=Bonamia ostreae TaxID=126728 RepID=A0ABV2AJH6_9EUKA
MAALFDNAINMQQRIGIWKSSVHDLKSRHIETLKSIDFFKSVKIQLVSKQNRKISSADVQAFKGKINSILETFSNAFLCYKSNPSDLLTNLHSVKSAIFHSNLDTDASFCLKNNKIFIKMDDNLYYRFGLEAKKSSYKQQRQNKFFRIDLNSSKRAQNQKLENGLKTCFPIGRMTVFSKYGDSYQDSPFFNKETIAKINAKMSHQNFENIPFYFQIENLGNFAELDNLNCQSLLEWTANVTSKNDFMSDLEIKDFVNVDLFCTYQNFDTDALQHIFTECLFC